MGYSDRPFGFGNWGAHDRIPRDVSLWPDQSRLLGLCRGHTALDARHDDGDHALFSSRPGAPIRGPAPRRAAFLPLLALDEHGRFDEGVGRGAPQAPRALRAGRRSAQPQAVRDSTRWSGRARNCTRRRPKSPRPCRSTAGARPTTGWKENVYVRFRNAGIVLLVVVDLVLFGIPGITMAAFQLGTMPMLAAGVINGLCHAKGYRNFETNDASTNLWPIGLFVAGEELHNNHHAFPTSARFSMRPHEVDMGWLHLKVLSLRWAWRESGGSRTIPNWRRKPLRPTSTRSGPSSSTGCMSCATTRTTSRCRCCAGSLTMPGEKRRSVFRAAKRLLIRDPRMLDDSSSRRLAELVDRHPGVRTVLQYRNELRSLWDGAYRSNENLLADFREWCRRAEASGIQGMADFVVYLKSFRASARTGFGGLSPDCKLTGRRAESGAVAGPSWVVSSPYLIFVSL